MEFDLPDLEKREKGEKKPDNNLHGLSANRRRKNLARPELADHVEVCGVLGSISGTQSRRTLSIRDDHSARCPPHSIVNG
jgi:hypothetical protein